jgi:hypothetical protein
MSGKLCTEIGKEFSSILLRDLGIDVMREVIEKNSTEKYEGVCASHDYCDANVVMAEAFNKICGREIELGSEEDCFWWGEAWNYAKANSFFIKE